MRFLAAILLFAIAAGVSAQGLGDLLNKAKSRSASAAKSVLGTSATAGVQGGIDVDEHPDVNNEAAQVAYLNAVLADNTPFVAGDRHHAETYDLRRLKQEHGIDIKTTWDHAALVKSMQLGDLLWAWPKDFYEALDRSLVKGPYYASRHASYAKVKEIHLTTATTEKASVNSRELNEIGWFPTWNPQTGVLTMAMRDKDGSGPSLAAELFTQYVQQTVK